MQKSLFERIGGEKAISDIIDITYDKVLVDPMISHHFQNTDICQLLDTFKRFFSNTFKGNPEGNLVNLKEAHKNMGLKNHEFERFFECMYKAMEELKIGGKEIEDVKKLYFGFQGDIVTA